MPLDIHIREIRQKQGYTIAELASKVGISTPHMSEVERGKKNLNNHLLQRISAALRVSPSALIATDNDAAIDNLIATTRGLSPDEVARVAAFASALLESQEATPRKG